MREFIRRRLQAHRYHATVRQLRTLPPSELKALGIPAAQIHHLAYEVSRARSGW